MGKNFIEDAEKGLCDNAKAFNSSNLVWNRGMATRVMFFEHGGDGALELDDRTMNRLVGIARSVFDDDRVHARQSRLQRALNIIGTGFAMTVFISIMGLDPRDMLAKPAQRVLDYRAQVLAHLVTAIGVRICVQKYLH